MPSASALRGFIFIGAGESAGEKVREGTACELCVSWLCWQ